MKRIREVLVVTLIAACLLGANLFSGSRAGAEGCPRGSLRGNLISQGDIARLSIRSEAFRCGTSRNEGSASAVPVPMYTYETLCNPDSDQGPKTLCSVAPCLQDDQSFAVRNRRLPDGRLEPAGFACLASNQVSVSSGITLAQVHAAVRNVKLPGGKIRVTPTSRGLANLKSFFWLEGASQAPVNLSIDGFKLHAEFRVVEYRWSFGEGEAVVTEGPGRPGLESEVNTVFRRRGVYPVEVTVVWVAEAFLDGSRVGEVDDLVSRAEMSYPVAELRTVLTG